MILWIGFIICTAAIVYAGTKLSRYGDIIAEKTGLGRTWIGVVLMASVTSLPELVTGISSVTFAGVPDIAAGDVLGSCVFNMLILAMLDAMHRPGPISTTAHYGHVLSAGFGIILLGIVVISLFVGDQMLTIGWIGPYSLLIPIVYLIAMRMIYFYEKKQLEAFIQERIEELRYRDITTRAAVLHYAGNAVIVIIAAVFLPTIGEGIAKMTGLGQTFVGNIFIALSTSLPEVVVCIAALRMDAVNLAIGNLFGSNIFNICILAIDDIFYTDGAILSSVNPNHIVSAICAVIMTSIAIVGLTYRTERKRLFLAWDSIAIVFTYMINLMSLYSLK
ncbi:MAG: sodium:calcium antiporter [Nitrospiraceae bacterium]|nr:MAG: sodium:calcium antiporter [Nitrospiraceae bacterium]